MLQRTLKTLMLLALLAPGLAPAQPGEAGGRFGVEEQLGVVIPESVTVIDAQGNEIALRDAIDKPTILTLVYFSCPGICTPLLNELADTVNLVKDEPGKDFQIVSISFNPADTPEIAAKKGANYREMLQREITPDGWRFFTATQDNIDLLTRTVGFYYVKRGEDFDHPGVLMFLSPRGKLTRYMHGTSFLATDVQMALTEAGQGRTGETRPVAQAPISGNQKYLSFCFKLDPESQKYVIDIQRVAATLILVGVAGFVIALFVAGRRKKGGPQTSPESEAPKENENGS